MNTKKLFSYLLAIVSIIPFLSSCDDKKEIENVEISTGVYVLNAGKFNKNNATITYYDFTSGFATTDVFAQKNGRILGDTGEDIIQYGSKIYIAVYQSSLIEVVDPKTMASIKSIPMVDANGNATKPRTLTCANGKIYIVLYSGSVAQMDTTTYAVEKTIAVGANPDKSVIANNKLYVANTGGMAAVKDSTISVINLSSFTEEKKIRVNLNPSGDLGVDSQGDVYVQSNGNYADIPGKFQRIEAGTDKVTDIAVGVKGFTVYKDKAYIYNFDYDASWQATNKKIIVYDLKNEKTENENIISTTIDKTPYGIDVNPVTGDIYLGVTDYSNMGKVYCFGNDGKEKFTFTAGLNPAKFLFLISK